MPYSTKDPKRDQNFDNHPCLFLRNVDGRRGVDGRLPVFFKGFGAWTKLPVAGGCGSSVSGVRCIRGTHWKVSGYRRDQGGPHTVVSLGILFYI